TVEEHERKEGPPRKLHSHGTRGVRLLGYPPPAHVGEPDCQKSVIDKDPATKIPSHELCRLPRRLRNRGRVVPAVDEMESQTDMDERKGDACRPESTGRSVYRRRAAHQCFAKSPGHRRDVHRATHNSKRIHNDMIFAASGTRRDSEFTLI